jgi:hypothetical protein
LSFNGNSQRKKHELAWHPKSNSQPRNNSKAPIA